MFNYIYEHYYRNVEYHVRSSILIFSSLSVINKYSLISHLRLIRLYEKNMRERVENIENFGKFASIS